MFWPKNHLESRFLTQKLPRTPVCYPKIRHFSKTTLYTGIYCETEINHCDSAPCYNSGTCENLGLAGFNCKCSDQTAGERCEGMNFCQWSRCENGVCAMKNIYEYDCVCDPGWRGLNCELLVDYCESNPCFGESICTGFQSGFSCECVSGFEGVLCDINENNCIPNPCKIYGVDLRSGIDGCLDKTNGFECVCKTSFQGDLCQNTVQFCQSDPCYPENTEQCVDKIDINGESFYECSCLAGFTGNRCFTDINECESEPCLNDGNCIDGINGYKCECLEDEFEGELCEVAIGGFGPVIPGNGGSSSIVVLTVVGAIVGLLGIVGVGVVRVGKVESLKKDMKSRTKNSTKEHCGKGVRKIEKSGGSGGRGRKRKRKVRGAGKK